MKKSQNKLIAAKSASSGDMEALATYKMQAGAYKEAIEIYKTLLKGQDKPEWKQALAECYLQRTLAFAEKGMLKEALVLWESYHKHSLSLVYFDHYLLWLLQVDIAKAKTVLQKLTAQQLDVDFPHVAAVLGASILAKKLDVEAVLPQDSMFAKHLSLAKAVLAAFREQNLEAAKGHLQAIPFRSAFKDFRTIMKAVLSASGIQQDTAAQLDKIVYSPYYKLAGVLSAIGSNGAMLVTNCRSLTHKQVQLVAQAKKLNAQQRELLEIATKQANLPNKLKFNLALQFKDLFGRQYSKRYCYAALADYPAGERDFSKQFGTFDEFEECRLKALSYEHKQDYHDALYYWKRGVRLLMQQPEQNKLKIAALMRYIAQKLAPLPESMVWLEDSLEYDDQDRDTYLNILRFYEDKFGDEGSEGKLEQWVVTSLEHYPNDVDILEKAINAAKYRQDYPQVYDYAARILKIDPVNRQAKQVQFDNQLAQLRQVIKAKKLRELEASLQQLAEFAISKRDQDTVMVMQALSQFALDKKAIAPIAEIVQGWYPDYLLVQHFYVNMEAALTGLPLATLVRGLLPLDKTYPLTADEAKQLIVLIQSYHTGKDSQELLHKVLAKVKAPIKNSLKRQQYDEPLCSSLCQCFDQIGHFELLKAVVDSVSYNWNHPIWPYYRVYAGIRGDVKKLGQLELMSLRLNLYHARNMGDERTAALIDKLICQYQWHTEGGDLVSSILQQMEDRDPLSLFNHLPDELFNKIDKKLAAWFSKTYQEQVFNTICRQYLQPYPESIELVAKDWDVMYALCFLKSAEDLQIDTEVTVLDILNFRKGQRPKS